MSKVPPETTPCQSPAARPPAANALRHGLTADRFLPSVLKPGRLPELVTRLRKEERPQTLLEELQISEIARHAAALEITEQAEPAVLRTGAQCIATMLNNEAGFTDDLLLSAAVTQEPLERVSRYRRLHEKALHQAIDKLRDLQQARRSSTSNNRDGAIAKCFATEQKCEDYLRDRFYRPP